MTKGFKQSRDIKSRPHYYHVICQDLIKESIERKHKADFQQNLNDLKMDSVNMSKAENWDESFTLNNTSWSAKTYCLACESDKISREEEM